MQLEVDGTVSSYTLDGSASIAQQAGIPLGARIVEGAPPAAAALPCGPPWWSA